MIVLDASATAHLLVDHGRAGDSVRERIGGGRLFAPELLDLEVMSTLRRGLRHGWLDERRANQALQDLADLPVTRAPHRRLAPRAWELRDNLTAYDAAYVALAEALGAPLVTFDAALARAPGPRCEVELLA